MTWNKYKVEKKQIYTGGTWVDSVPLETRTGEKIGEYDSFLECSGIPPTPSNYKWIATYDGGAISSAECDSSSAITSGEITKTDLESVEISNCVTSIGNNVFQNCSSLTSVTISDSVTSIGRDAFSYSENLEAVNIPSGITSISSATFYGCSSLISIDIPNGVTNIGPGAFRDCSSLTTITIPSSVTNIGNYAFYGCNGLTEIIIEATTPPTLGSWTPLSDNNCPIRVPAASLSAYQNAWPDYASRIVALSS